MKEVRNAIVCQGCDALYQRAALRPREVARCARCGTELERHPGQQHRRILPLTLASLIMFGIANLFPIVEIELKGLSSQTTLAGAVVALAREGLSPVALLVLATTILFPLLQLCILAWLLVPLTRGRQPPGFNWLVRAMQSLRPWGMIEVFLLGVLVAVVKLSSMATVLPGPALWAFMALTVLLTAVLSFDPRTFWEMAVRPATGEEGEASLPPLPPVDPASASAEGALVPLAPTAATAMTATTARAHGLIACPHCSTVWRGAGDGERCGVCATRLHVRKPDSLNRTWALLIAACAMYLPANLLPVMITRTLFGAQSDTIMSGVIYFWVSGAYGLAAIVFIASFLVPLFKLAALFVLVVSAQRRSEWRRTERARLYHAIEVIGRWSMLDVFVVAVLAGLVRIQGFAEITAGVGIAAFGAVVVLTMLASLSFDPRLSWDEAPPDPSRKAEQAHERIQSA